MKINIQNVPHSIREGSLRINDSINKRSTASFTVLDKNSEYHFKQGLPVEIADYGEEITIQNGYTPTKTMKSRISYIQGKTSEVNGLLQSVTPTINGIPLNKTLRGLTSVYDEYVKDKITRRCSEPINLWEESNITSITYTNTYRFNFTKIEIKYIGQGKISNFSFIPSGGDSRHWEWTGSQNQYAIWVEKTLIDSQSGATLIDKCKAYLQSITCQGVFELQAYTEEPAKPIIFDMVQDTPITIDSLDTTIKAILDYELYFSGFINTSREKVISQYNDDRKEFRTHSIECKDNHYLADKRLAKKSFVNMYCGDIVRELITLYLGEEGVWEDTIQQGEYMDEVVFNWVKVTKAIERLAEVSGFIWYIDYDKGLDFIDRNANVNSVSLTESDCVTINVEIGNQEYRNKQYIKGGKALTDTLTDTFKGDGTNKNFTLGFPCGEKPIVKVNGVTIAEVGIRGVEEGMKWYWSKGDYVISQNDTDTALATTDTLQVVYKGLFDVLVSVPELAQIDKRASLENNSGIIEHVEEELDNNSTTTSLNSAVAKLNKYAVEGKSITIRTRRNDLESGQLIRANFPKFDINEDVLIYSDSIKTEKTSEGYIVWHDIELLVGPEATSFYKIMSKGTESKVRIIRENIDEKGNLVLLFTFSKTWTTSDSPNIFYEVLVGDLTVGDTALGLEDDERVGYVEILSGTTVLGRFNHVKQVISDKITTTYYIKNQEAVGNITSFNFYGGTQATETIGSGILIDTHTLNYTKTNLEILQINREDIG